MTEFSLKTIIDKMMKYRIITDNDCWEINKISAWGYSQIRCFGVTWYCHRISAAYYHNMNLENKTQFSLHKNECHNRKCWNPDHLYVGGKRENIMDVISYGNHNMAKKTHCKNGHKFNSSRKCRICNIKYQEERRKKQGIKPLEKPFSDPSIDIITGRKKT